MLKMFGMLLGSLSIERKKVTPQNSPDWETSCLPLLNDLSKILVFGLMTGEGAG